jgi:hypothetical protein
MPRYGDGTSVPLHTVCAHSVIHITQYGCFSISGDCDTMTFSTGASHVLHDVVLHATSYVLISCWFALCLEAFRRNKAALPESRTLRVCGMGTIRWQLVMHSGWMQQEFLYRCNESVKIALKLLAESL